MKGLDVEGFIRFYVEENEDPMKDYELVREAIELEEQTKAAIAAQMELMAQQKGGKESRKDAKKRKKEELKRNKEEAKSMRKSRKSA
jgi:hypothetical protein|eukprot:COSAG03_NODE_218_length_10458_cov_7.740033_6_plen_87_part_00